MYDAQRRMRKAFRFLVAIKYVSHKGRTEGDDALKIAQGKKMIADRDDKLSRDIPASCISRATCQLAGLAGAKIACPIGSYKVCARLETYR